MYVIARTGKGRPTLQHRLITDDDGGQTTACGMDIMLWSRAYQNRPIVQVYCKRCNKSPR